MTSLAVERTNEETSRPPCGQAPGAFSPSLFEYVSHLHIAVSGFIAATGLAVPSLVACGVRRGQL